MEHTKRKTYKNFRNCWSYLKKLFLKDNENLKTICCPSYNHNVLVVIHIVDVSISDFICKVYIVVVTVHHVLRCRCCYKAVVVLTRRLFSWFTCYLHYIIYIYNIYIYICIFYKHIYHIEIIYIIHIINIFNVIYVYISFFSLPLQINWDLPTATIGLLRLPSATGNLLIIHRTFI